MKKTELTINDTIMAAMALKFLGCTGVFKQIDLDIADGKEEDAALIEEIAKVYRDSEAKTVFDAFKTTEAFTHFMTNNVFNGNQYTDQKKATCGSKKEEEETKKCSTDQQAEEKSDKRFEEEFKKKTAEAIVFLIEENEEIKEKIDMLAEQIKTILKIFISKQEAK